MFYSGFEGGNLRQQQIEEDEQKAKYSELNAQNS